MKKILICFILFIGFAQANDKDGVFLGFELGLGEVKTTESFNGATSNTKLNLPLYGFRIGYTRYFSDFFGISTYVNFRDLFQSASVNGVKTHIDIMSFAANMDFLLDFYNERSVSVGAFAGIGIGGANVKGKVSGTLNDSISEFYGDIKLGLKTSYGFNSISFIASFPLVPVEESTFVGAGFPTYNSTLKTNYAISLAYDYRF